MEKPRYLSINDAAKALRISRQTVLGRVVRGELRYTTVDQRVVILADDVDAAAPSDRPKSARRTA